MQKDMRIHFRSMPVRLGQEMSLTRMARWWYTSSKA